MEPDIVAHLFEIPTMDLSRHSRAQHASSADAAEAQLLQWLY